MMLKKMVLEALKIIVLIVFVSLIISFYQWLAHQIVSFSDWLIASNWLLTGAIALLFCTCLIYLNRKVPGYSGSGIPQVEAYHAGWYSFNPFWMMGLVFINSLMSFFSGFLLGGEGPSVTIASSMALSVNRLFHKEDKELVACCGSAGFACAFLSPLAGLFHLLEENRSVLKLSLLLKGVLIIVVSSFLAQWIYPHRLLPITFDTLFPYDLFYVFLLVVLVGVTVGKLYIFFIAKIKDLSLRFRYFYWIAFALVVLCLVFKRYLPQMSGSGTYLLENRLVSMGLLWLVVLLIGRMLGTAFCNATLFSGGLVLPMLALGALSGEIVVAFVAFFRSDIVLYEDLIKICAMFTVFAVVCKTPLTAIALSLQTGAYDVVLLPVSICVLTSFVIVSLFKWPNIYQELEKRLPGYALHHQERQRN